MNTIAIDIHCDMTIILKNTMDLIQESAKPGKFIVWHSTHVSFDPSQIKTPAYFSDDKNLSGAFGSKSYKYEITIDNPEIIEDAGMHHEYLNSSKEIKRLKKNGVDGVVIKNQGRPTIYLVFDKGQVKLLE